MYRASTKEDTFRAMAESQHFIAPVPDLCRSTTVSDQKRTRNLAKLDLKELLVSEWPSFTKILRPLQHVVSTSACNIFLFEPLQNVHLRI